MHAGIIVVKVLWMMVTVGVAEMLAPVALFHFDLAAVGAIPVMVFAYHCHVQSVPIYYELSFDPALFDCAKLRRAAHERRQQLRQQPEHSAAPPEAASSAADAGADGDPTVENAPLLPQANGSSSATAAPPTDDSPAGAGTVLRTAGEVRRKLFGMARVLAAAYAECTVLYLATGVAGYILFPKHVESNILKNFPADDALMQVLQPLSVSSILHLSCCLDFSTWSLVETEELESEG